jgi:hypothetical protein
MSYPPQQPPGDWGGQQPAGQPYERGQQPDYGAPLEYGQQPGGYPDDPSWTPQSDPQHSYQPPTSGAAYQPQQYPPMSAGPMSGPPMAGQPWPPQQPPPARSGPPVWLFAVLGVVVVLALGAGAFFVFGPDGGDDPGDDSGRDSPSASSSAGSDDPTATDDSLITDTTTGLSYTPIGDPWTALQEPGSAAGFISVVGETLQVEDFGNNRHWIATFYVGETDADTVGFTDADSIESALEAQCELVDSVNYNKPPDFDKPLDGLERDSDPEFDDVTVGEYSGKVLSYHLAWKDDSIKETGETVAVGMLDLGDGKAAGFLISLPDSIIDDNESVLTDAIESMKFA